MLVTNSMTSVQPRDPTLLDDGSIKTRSMALVLQFDSALRQTYSISTPTSRLIHLRGRGVDPYGTGGTCPPIFVVGDTIMNVHFNILE